MLRIGAWITFSAESFGGAGADGDVPRIDGERRRAPCAGVGGGDDGAVVEPHARRAVGAGSA